MRNNLALIICLLVIIGISGCATISPLATHLESNFEKFHPAARDNVKSHGSRKEIDVSYEEAWEDALYILSQYAIITDASKEAGHITYIDVDGLYLKDVYTRHKFSYWEFPFTLYMEEGSRGVVLYVYPMKDMYKKYSGRWWWKNVDAAFDQKIAELIEKLSTQIESGSRWQWLSKSSK